jgi:hypothetical protein
MCHLFIQVHNEKTSPKHSLEKVTPIAAANLSSNISECLPFSHNSNHQSSEVQK